MITSATRDCPVISVAVPLLNGLPLAHVQAVAAGEAARQARALGGYAPAREAR